jgi:hypothetical protein
VSLEQPCCYLHRLSSGEFDKQETGISGSRLQLVSQLANIHTQVLRIFSLAIAVLNGVHIRAVSIKIA